MTMMGGKTRLGNLYNWYAASDVNFAPTGWSLPTESQYQILSDYLGGDSVSGGKLKEAGFSHWGSPNTGATNESGFTAFGNGYRFSDGVFYEIKITGYYSMIEEKFVYLSNNSDDLFLQTASKKTGGSIRLIYTGGGTPPSTIQDYDGNVYDVVQIGSQYWTKQNWKCTHLSKTPFTALTKVTDNIAWAALTSEGYCAYNNDESLV